MQELGQQHNRVVRAAPDSSNAAIGLTAFEDYRALILGRTDQDHGCPMKRASAISEAMHQLARRLSWHRPFNPRFVSLSGTFETPAFRQASGLEMRLGWRLRSRMLPGHAGTSGRPRSDVLFVEQA